MAPVAGRVADRDQQRDVAASRLLERLGSPLPPVDRVLCVLQQIRARSAGETVSACPSHSLTGPPANRRGKPAGDPCPGSRAVDTCGVARRTGAPPPAVGSGDVSDQET